MLLAIGITMTIPLVIFGSALLAFLIDRFPVLIYAGAGLLVYIAVEMFFQDVALEAYLELFASAEWIVATVAAVVFLAIAWAWARRTGEGKEDPSKLGKS